MKRDVSAHCVSATRCAGHRGIISLSVFSHENVNTNTENRTDGQRLVVCLQLVK